jgi:site-specific DNA-methyltransferase (adenine-specific)
VKTKAKVDQFFNEDCIEGSIKHIKDNFVDLIITDPPYGIEGHTLHKHYNRKEEYVLDGYIEIPKHEYAKFSENWIKQAERILRPGGSIYIVSGYTNQIGRASCRERVFRAV